MAAVFTAVLLAAFSARLRRHLRRWIQAAPRRLWLGPLLLWLFFCVLVALAGGLRPSFAWLLAAYLLAPTALLQLGARVHRGASWAELAAVLLLWLPVEFALGKQWLPAHAHPLANEAAQGTALALALWLFIVYRDWPGAKYNLPRRWSDALNPLAGFAVAALLLAPLGLALGFLGGLRQPLEMTPAGGIRLFLIILVGVAIPEELLFRSLIQSWLMRRLGASQRTLAAAALIFGAAHLNNGPGPLPNWRYMILATIAGFIYGKVFQRSSTVLSSAALHAMVNWVRHVYFT